LGGLLSGDRRFKKHVSATIEENALQRRENLNMLFKYPADIRKAIYTTNVFEQCDSQSYE